MKIIQHTKINWKNIMKPLVEAIGAIALFGFMGTMTTLSISNHNELSKLKLEKTSAMTVNISKEERKELCDIIVEIDATVKQITKNVNNIFLGLIVLSIMALIDFFVLKNR